MHEKAEVTECCAIVQLVTINVEKRDGRIGEVDLRRAGEIAYSRVVSDAHKEFRRTAKGSGLAVVGEISFTHI